MNASGDSERHRRSIRIGGFDYSATGAYFVTLVAEHRRPLFGTIVDGEVLLAGQGRVALHEWERLPARFPRVVLDAFVIMPNHVHGVIVLVDPESGAGRSPRAERFGRPVPGSIPTIVRSYKAAAALGIARLPAAPPGPVWQRSYYEHVIRDEADLDRIRLYIHQNPLTWSHDHENPSRTP